MLFALFAGIGGFFLINNKLGNDKVIGRDYIVVKVTGKHYYPFPQTFKKGLALSYIVEKFRTLDSLPISIYKTTKGKVLRSDTKIFSDINIKV